MYKVTDLKTRLDKFLTTVVSDRSRSQLQRDIELGQVVVNDALVLEPKHIVRINDLVSYNPTQLSQAQPSKSLELKTLYHQHGLLIIDKPPGLVVHKGAGFKGDSLADFLLYQFKRVNSVGEEGRFGIVHRLDKDTSGVILIALDQLM